MTNLIKNGVKLTRNSKDVPKTSEQSRKLALKYMSTLVDVARESFIILDSELVVVAANPTFYKTFQVKPENTANKLLYDLGNGQWNIPNLKSLLEEILPKKKDIRDYEVAHNFEAIGEKTMLLNARQIDSVQLIILAMEDITERKELEKKLAEYARKLETTVAEKTEELSGRVSELERVNKSMVGRELKMVELKKEIESLKKRTKNGSPRAEAGNGNHNNGK
jgi:transcriptional regulator with PAS, ATPase and Fis domain